MKRRITVLVVLASITLTACSTFHPHVNQYKTSSRCDGGNLEQTRSNPQRLADYLRCEYTDVLNGRVAWDRGSGIAIGTALAFAAYKGVSGTNNSHQIAALTTGAASIYGVNQIFVNDKVSAVYAAGIQAISCTTKKHNSVMRLGNIQTKAEKQIVTLQSIVNNKIDECRQSVNDASKLLDKYRIATTLIALETQSVVSELNAVDASVKLQVDQLLPNIDSIFATASGIPTTAKSFSISEPPEMIDGIHHCNHYENALEWYKVMQTLSQEQSSLNNSPDNSKTVCDPVVAKRMIAGDQGAIAYKIAKDEKNARIIDIFYSSGKLRVIRPSAEPNIQVSDPVYNKESNTHQIKVWTKEKFDGAQEITIIDYKQDLARTINVEFAQ